MSKEKLKPCPFCGSSDLTIKRNYQLDGMTFVVCESCGAVSSFFGNEQLEQTKKAWNKRPKIH